MPSPYPVLYSFRRCPYAMRARLAIYSAQKPHEHREVDLKNKPEEMLILSPKGTVPVLHLTEGTILEQSLDIMQWALSSPQLSPIAQELIAENDTTFKKSLDRYKYPGRYEEEQGVDYRQMCLTFLTKIENQLSPFLEGEKMSLVDMALFPFIRQFAMVDPDWFEEQSYPHIKKWLNDFQCSTLFKDVMQSFSPWQVGDEEKIITF